jgi:hypothetical protein
MEEIFWSTTFISRDEKMKIQEKNYYLTPQEEALKDATKA